LHEALAAHEVPQALVTHPAMVNHPQQLPPHPRDIIAALSVGEPWKYPLLTQAPYSADMGEQFNIKGARLELNHGATPASSL